MKILSELVGESPGVEALRDKVGRVLARQQDARRLPPILIEGETGTGKGLLARMIHRASPRCDGPFVDVNCAAIPETLLEAEMFGFERGAFTDARRAKPGLLQAAHRGTIFLDEIGLLPEALQAKLLKVLEERVVRRLGSTRDEPVDVWILTATNEDLRVAVRARRFREDLYHRLAVLMLTLPPLRERGEDVLRLAEHFLARACADYGVPAKSLMPDARAALLAYPWPGNVRELGNLMERVALLSSEPEVMAPMLGLPGGRAPEEPEAPRDDKAASLDDAVRERVAEVLRQTNWNISRSAALLGISRNTLRARIEKYALRPGTAPPPASPRAERPPARVPAAPAPDRVGAPPALRWERRRVMLLRAALVTEAEPDAQLEASRALEVLAEKVRSFGGRVEGLSPSGIVAAFGLEAIEDAPSRAAHAAMAMQRAIQRARHDGIPLPAVAVGIHLDEFLIGIGTGAAELDFETKQRALAVLAAISQRGEAGSILVSDVAAPFLVRRFELLDFVAGGELGRVFALAGRDSTGLGARGQLVTFVGRYRELELLWSRLESVLRGQGQIVGISGEAGIGKSRLVYEFRHSLAGKAVVYAEARCVSYGAATPYLLMLDVLKASCSISDADAPDVVKDRVAVALRDVGMDPAADGPFFLDLLGMEDDEAKIALLEPDTIRARLFETLRQLLLRRSRQHPLVLVLEDLHWIDAASDEMFASLAEALPGSPIFLVSTYRSGYRPPWIERSYATQVALQPLAPDDSLRILHSVLGADLVSDALADRIVFKAEGNPLFIEELARNVKEQAGESPILTVPDTIQEVLRGRIDRLAPEDKRLLEIAAVVGKDVPLPIIEAVAATSGERLRASLGRLKSGEFLYETSPGPEAEYTFKHALTRDAAYERLLPDQRQAYHARIVGAVEEVFADRLGEHVERLAHHALLGEVWDKAVGYLRQAAARAAARSANREAVAHLEQALGALAHLPEGRARTEQAIDIRLDLRLALLPLGELDRILPYLHEAEELAERLGDQHRLGRLYVYLTGQFRLMGDHDRALEYGRRTQAVTKALGDFDLEVSTNAYVGQNHLDRGEYRAAAVLFRRNVESLVGDLIHERFGLPQLPAVHSRFCLVLCLAELGEFAEGIARGEESVRIAESIDQPLNVTVAASGLGTLYLRKGDAERAMLVLEPGLETCRKWNIRIWFPRIASALGSVYALAGRMPDAVPLLEEAVERAEAMRLLSAQAAALTGLAEARLLAGRPAEARDSAGRAVEIAQRNGERGHEAWALRLLGEIALRSAPPDATQAQERFLHGLALSTELDMRPLIAHCHLGLGQASRLAGDRASAEEHLGKASGLFREMEMRVWESRCAEERARLL